MKCIKKKAYKGIILLSLIPVVLVGNNSKAQSKKTSDVKTSYELVDSTSELKLYFEEDITFDIVRENLQNNAQISDEYKKYTNEFINLVEEKFPNIDLTILNENIKKFKVLEITEKEMKLEKNREAYYVIPLTTITMHDNYNSENTKKYCFFHELWHMFNNLYMEKDGVVYCKTPTMFDIEATAFDEGMNTFLTKQIMSSDIMSYPNQYDEINILYYIYGNELLEVYLDSGVDGIELFLSGKVKYQEAYSLIELMNAELNKELTDPTPIFDILFKLYSIEKDSSLEYYKDMLGMLDNLCYNEKTKEQILDSFLSLFYSPSVTEDWYITFNNNDFYKISDLYFVKCGEEEYLVNDDILLHFFESRSIKNIYDEDDTYIGNQPIYSKDDLINYINYYGAFANYDEENHIISVNMKELRGGSYVKSK